MLANLMNPFTLETEQGQLGENLLRDVVDAVHPKGKDRKGRNEARAIGGMKEKKARDGKNKGQNSVH